MHLKFSGAVRRRLHEMQAQAGDLSVPMRIISQDLLRSAKRNFQAQGRRDEATNLWPRHSPTTIERRRTGQKRGGARVRILENTGRLKNSLTARSGTLWAGVGTAVEYASDHQQRGQWGARKRIHRLVRIPAHTQKRRVSEDYDAPKGDPAHHFVKSGAFDLGKRNLQRRARKKQAQMRRHAEQARKAIGRRKKGRSTKGTKIVPVPVRAHTQLQNYLLPARPFLWIHKADVDRARLRIVQWVRRTRGRVA